MEAIFETKRILQIKERTNFYLGSYHNVHRQQKDIIQDQDQGVEDGPIPRSTRNMLFGMHSANKKIH